MSDYISREKLAKKATHYEIAGFKTAKVVLLKDVMEVPAADVRPVVRGKWMLVDTEDGDRDDTLLMTWWCNRCGKEFKTAGRLDFDFCPNCGADMREWNYE